MRRISTFAAACMLFVFSCQKKDMKPVLNEAEDLETSGITQRCASQEVLQERLTADPSLKSKIQAIEDFTARVLQNKSQYRRLSDGTIEIPVYFHVLYRAAEENITNTQLQSQIDVLNEDFNEANSDISKVPDHFKGVVTNVQVRFVWNQANINRKYVNKKQWSTNDDMKFASKGGSNAVSTDQYLNIWVVNKMVAYGGTILGYAQFPGGGSPLTDGVVLGHNFTGRIGRVSAPYDLGRTATHEVGHWLNLRHIWGDATCGNDLVGDTPQHNTSNGGCPSLTHRSTCAGQPLEMWMNYMDYTYDACMYMFTDLQRDRMRAVFASGGYRQTLGL